MLDCFWTQTHNLFLTAMSYHCLPFMHCPLVANRKMWWSIGHTQPLPGFEPGSADVGSNSSANWGATTGPPHYNLCLAVFMQSTVLQKCVSILPSFSCPTLLLELEIIDFKSDLLPQYPPRLWPFSFSFYTLNWCRLLLGSRQCDQIGQFFALWTTF